MNNHSMYSFEQRQDLNLFELVSRYFWAIMCVPRLKLDQISIRNIFAQGFSWQKSLDR